MHNTEKEEIIEYIVKNNPSILREELMHLSYSSLIIIKVQIEIELFEKDCNSNDRKNKN